MQHHVGLGHTRRVPPSQVPMRPWRVNASCSHVFQIVGGAGGCSTCLTMAPVVSPVGWRYLSIKGLEFRR
jgi:hypothetical protein